MPQEQIGRVEELFTVHTDARVRDAPKQQHWVLDCFKHSSAFRCLSHTSIGVQTPVKDFSTLSICSSVPRAFSSWLFRFQGASVFESIN